jgi:hypothetical protein
MSPAWCVLSLSARRLLDRIEIEMMSHGGPRSNGGLPVTYGDFIKYGVRRNSIASALREVVALGFLEITEQGRGGNAAYRKASKFRLTCHQFKANEYGEVLYEPTNEWRRFKTIEEAEAIAAKAKRAVAPCRPYKARRKKQKAGPQNGTVPPPEMGDENGQSPPPEMGGTARPPERGVPIISSRDRAEGYGPVIGRTTTPEPEREEPEIALGSTPPAQPRADHGRCTDHDQQGSPLRLNVGQHAITEKRRVFETPTLREPAEARGKAKSVSGGSDHKPPDSQSMRPLRGNDCSAPES